MKKEKDNLRVIRKAVGFLAYRLLEILDGERLPNIRLVSYRKAQPLKIACLALIEGGNDEL